MHIPNLEMQLGLELCLGRIHLRIGVAREGHVPSSEEFFGDLKMSLRSTLRALNYDDSFS